MVVTVVKILVGLIVLVAGGEALVRGASSLARRWGVRPMVIGLTIVAFGTSMPEAVVSWIASLDGRPDVAAGNVVGSNIFNITLILGIAALVRPIRTHIQTVRREMPVVILSAVAFAALLWDGRISRLDGLLLLAGFGGFLALCFRNVQGDAAPAGSRQAGWLAISAGIAGGLIALVAGSRLFVDGAVALARTAGVSELVIGLTIVAAGTSLPELVTSVVAAARKEDDISIGNIAGSNIFNLLFIGGSAAVLHPADVSSSLIHRDVPAMIGASLLLLPLIRSGFMLTRWEGGLLLFSYGAYLALLMNGL